MATKNAWFNTWRTAKAIFYQKIGQVLENSYGQAVKGSGRSCTLMQGSRNFYFQIQRGPIAEFWEKSGGAGDAPSVEFYSGRRTKIKLPFQRRSVFVFVGGQYRSSLAEITISPGNLSQLYNCSDDIGQLQETVVWIIAHELRHHQQYQRKLWRMRAYHESIVAEILAEYDAWRFAEASLKKYRSILDRCITVSEKTTADKNIIIEWEPTCY